MRPELKVIADYYEFMLWTIQRTEKFPRSHRYGLGQRIETRLYAIFQGLSQAKYAAGRRCNSLFLHLHNLRNLWIERAIRRLHGLRRFEVGR